MGLLEDALSPPAAFEVLPGAADEEDLLRFKGTSSSSSPSLEPSSEGFLLFLLLTNPF